MFYWLAVSCYLMAGICVYIGSDFSRGTAVWFFGMGIFNSVGAFAK